jgi:NCAIR mutase (PurE)-related protein
MDDRKIKNILNAIKKGDMNVQDALGVLKDLPYENIGMARVDHHRALRHGIPEVIYAEGKELNDIAAIAGALLKKSGRLIITKATRSVHKRIERVCKGFHKKAKYHEKSRTITVGGRQKKSGMIAVISAGTSDIPVAEGSAVTASFLGSKVETIYDVGVAGLHRLLDAKDAMNESSVLIVVAGMEGALPSVVGGMCDKPIIAVPTSVGYGTNLGGITPLFAMLNSCVPGIAVMNIDNGFGAGVLAHKINQLTVDR